ncbi:hypothetical protein ACOMHN_020037 [Nucella lapillus]
MKPKDKIANLLKSDKTLTESNQEKAEVLNSFFASVFTEEEKDNIPNFPQRTSEKLLTLEISTKDMEDKLKKLNPTKSEGPDGLHPRILKELAHELSYPLKILFDKSIKENKIPTAWKQAEALLVVVMEPSTGGEVLKDHFYPPAMDVEGRKPRPSLPPSRWDMAGHLWTNDLFLKVECGCEVWCVVECGCEVWCVVECGCESFRSVMQPRVREISESISEMGAA